MLISCYIALTKFYVLPCLIILLLLAVLSLDYVLFLTLYALSLWPKIRNKPLVSSILYLVPT